jgi:hypothetical protein
MSTGKMPEPPDTPTSKTVVAGSAEALAGASAETTAEKSDQPMDLKSQMASVIEEQADVIAQKLVYNSQLTYGVSAIGVDFVNARTSALVVANALRSGNMEAAEDTLANLGDSQVHQVNDQAIPYKNNSLVAGILEGILLDTVTRAVTDSAQRLEARKTLAALFESANARALRQPLSMRDQWPGGGPNARS